MQHYTSTRNIYGGENFAKGFLQAGKVIHPTKCLQIVAKAARERKEKERDVQAEVMCTGYVSLRIHYGLNS